MTKTDGEGIANASKTMIQRPVKLACFNASSSDSPSKKLFGRIEKSIQGEENFGLLYGCLKENAR